MKRLGPIGQALLRAAELSPEDIFEKPRKPSVWERLTLYAVPMSEQQARQAEAAKKEMLRRQLARDRKRYYELTKRYSEEIDRAVERWKRYAKLVAYIRRRIRWLESRKRGFERVFHKTSTGKAFFISRKIGYLEDRLDVWRRLLQKAERAKERAKEMVDHLYTERRKAIQLQKRLKELDPMEWALPDLPGIRVVPKDFLRISEDELSEYVDARGFRLHYLHL